MAGEAVDVARQVLMLPNFDKEREGVLTCRELQHSESAWTLRLCTHLLNLFRLLLVASLSLRLWDMDNPHIEVRQVC